MGDSHYNPKDYIRDGSEEGIQDEGRNSHFSSLVEVQGKRKYPKIQGTHALTTTSHPTTLYSQILSLHLEVEDLQHSSTHKIKLLENMPQNPMKVTIFNSMKRWLDYSKLMNVYVSDNKSICMVVLKKG